MRLRPGKICNCQYPFRHCGKFCYCIPEYIQYAKEYKEYYICVSCKNDLDKYLKAVSDNFRTQFGC